MKGRVRRIVEIIEMLTVIILAVRMIEVIVRGIIVAAATAEEWYQ